MVPEYWLEADAWFEAIPIEDGYDDLGASMAMLCYCRLDYFKTMTIYGGSGDDRVCETSGGSRTVSATSVGE